ncbi:MAG: Ig-like domain-containing protein [Patescibacteria group bacterium]
MGRGGKKNIYLGILAVVFLSVGGFFVCAHLASAQTALQLEDVGGTLGLTTVNLKTLVINIIRWFLGIISLVAVAYLIYGGILWLTSAGNEEKIKKAKKTILNAIIGVIIVLLSWAIFLLVTHFITDATNGNGNQACTPPAHTADDCYVCQGSPPVWVPNGSPANPALCLAFPTDFRLNDIETSAISDLSEIYTCSNIQSRFNNGVYGTSVDSAVTADTLKIEKVDGSVKKEGAWQTNARTVTFYPRRCSNPPNDPCRYDADCGGGNTCDVVYFDDLSDYRLHLPKSIQDVSAPVRKNLSSFDTLVLGPWCQDAGTEIQCTFHTSDQKDIAEPILVSAYPVLSTQAGYPDTNVPRLPTISVLFSENVDAGTVVDSVNPSLPNSNNIFIQQYDAQNGSLKVGGAVDSNSDGTVDPDKLRVGEAANGFNLFLQGGYFEAFTWYKITVQNIEDLCGNTMTPASVEWWFETNDVVPGFTGFYPTGNNECPDVHAWATFGTAMYMYDVTLTINDISAGPKDAPRVIGINGSTTTTGSASNYAGTLTIRDFNESTPANGNKWYEFVPATPFSPSHTYAATIATNLVIDTSGGTLATAWQFKVATAADCTCTPAIASLSPAPSAGLIGECLTINGSCFTGTAAHAATPINLTFGSLTADIQGFGNNFITTISPDPRPVTFPNTVAIKFSIDYGATYGVQNTAAGYNYTYNSDKEATGPCLFSISPSVTYPGTAVTLTGIRFNPANPATRRIDFIPPGLSPSISSWSDGQIYSSVPSTSFSGTSNASLTNDIGTSNSVPFTINQYPPGVPVVTRYWPTCDSACTNAVAGATFSEEMDRNTMTTANIKLDHCTDIDCNDFVMPAPVYSVSYDIPGKTLTIIPSANMLPDSWYKVTLLEGIKSTANVSIGNPNDGTSFIWKYKTKNDASLCAPASVDVSPATYTAKINQTDLPYTAYAKGSPDSCNAGGQILNGNAYDWSWTSLPLGLANVSNTDSNGDGNVDSAQRVATLGNPGATNIFASVGSLNNRGVLNITVDPTYCYADADCNPQPANPCPGSVCRDNHCTPVINSFLPTDGAVGTWVTINGCWFGNFEDGKSKVLFRGIGGDKEGIVPNPMICGPGTWTNTRIVRESPNASTADLADDAIDGSIKVVRGFDSAEVSTATNFDVNNLSHPGICYVNPESGREGITEVQIRGKNFGTSKQSTDHVTFYNSVGRIEADYTPAIWEDNNIRVIVPVGAQTSLNEGLKITKGAIDSNPWPFTVAAADCTPCTADSECAARACGADKCCHDRPSVASTTPLDGATNVCLNTVIEVRFNQDMDVATFTPGNITVMRSGPPAGPVPVNSQNITAGSRWLRLNFGLLAGNNQYVIRLAAGIKNAQGIAMGGDYQFGFTTANTSDPCQLSRITIDPTVHTFMKSDPAKEFSAQAYDNNNNQINRIPGVYSWTWSWSVADSSILVLNAPGDSDTVNAQPAAPRKNGNTTLKVEAKALDPVIGFTGSKEATAAVRVINCDVAWTFTDQANNCESDVIFGGCGNSYNFRLEYCRGLYGLCQGGSAADVCSANYAATCPTGETCCPAATPNCTFTNNKPLPFFDIQTASGQTGNVLKQFLFKESDDTKKDGIGVRIFANPELLSPTAWYDINIKIKGSPQTTTVDGYEAIRDGRTVYVAAPNLQGGTLYNNIYLISYNDDAEPSTVDIFNQMVSNWYFNTNMNATDKPLLARDLRRVSDLRTIISYLESYRADHQESIPYPAMQAGSYLKNMTFSNWKVSWQGTLANALQKALPEDPRQSVLCKASSPATVDKNTCWDEPSKSFTCDMSGTYLYAYKTDQGLNYELYAQLEYRGQGTFLSSPIPTYNLCVSPSDCACFNYRITGP